jgi:hypothetical protein
MFHSCCMPRLAVSTGRRHISMKGDVHLSNRRVMRKIQVGKARPTIFHQFETLIELSDGLVIRRTSQAPKDEIRMINDQRNSTLWNPHRLDLVSVDAAAADRVNKFKQRFATFDKFETAQDKRIKSLALESEEQADTDDYMDLMGINVQEVQRGGKLYNKKLEKQKKKK